MNRVSTCAKIFQRRCVALPYYFVLSAPTRLAGRLLHKYLMAWCLFMLFMPVAHAAQTIKSFESDSLQHILSGQKGKPFVLMVWSLDCPYCQASLNTIAQEKRKNKRFNVVTLSTDSLLDEQAEAKMKEKLQSLGMTANAWAFGASPSEQLRYAIDAKWHGEMPRSYWFNAKGESVAYSGLITPAMIAKLMPGI